MRFQPLRMTGSDPQWEDWNCYANPLLVYDTDYNRFLMPYFEQLFPVIDPIDQSIQDRMDVCFGNWIGKQDWIRFMDYIKRDMNTLSQDIRKFYQELINWIVTALNETEVIVVEGNL